MDSLSAVLERIATATPGSRGEAIAQLAKAYLRHSEDDTLSVDDTYARVIELFRFIENRSEKAKIRAFNPTMAEHGYTSTGTVLELSVDDGPFLFDTVAAELHRRDLKVLRAEHPVIGTVRQDNVLTSIVPGRQSGHRESVQHFELNKKKNRMY